MTAFHDLQSHQNYTSEKKTELIFKVRTETEKRKNLLNPFFCTYFLYLNTPCWGLTQIWATCVTDGDRVTSLRHSPLVPSDLMSLPSVLHPSSSDSALRRFTIVPISKRLCWLSRAKGVPVKTLTVILSSRMGVSLDINCFIGPGTTFMFSITYIA